MSARWLDYFFIFATIALTVFGQVVLKWRMDQFGALLDPVVVSSFASAFLAGLAWMAALTRFELSYAYPFMSLSFVLVLVISVIFLGETLTLNKVLGVALIGIGTVIASAGTQ
jgi:uncharacterized membrane protein